MRSRRSPGSLPMVASRPPISRSVRSSSARRARASRDRPSSSIRRARPSATADWPAMVSSRAASSGPKASTRVDQTVIAPNGPWSPWSGVAMTPWIPLDSHVRVRPVPVDEVRVLEVVARDVGLAGHHGAPGRPDLERVVRVPRPLGLEDLLVARREQALEQPRLGVDDVDPGAVAVEQAEGLVDRELDDRLGIAGAGDAGAELAQRPLDDRLALAGLPRAVELGDEPRVGHRERGVLGERADERDLGRGERVGVARERAQRPEDLHPGDQRRDDERAQPDLVDEPVRCLARAWNERFAT